MKITKSQLRQLIREEIQKESGAFGTYAAPISGTGGRSYSGSRTSGRPRMSGSPEPEAQYPNLAKLSPDRQNATRGAFRQFELENDKLPAGQKLSDEKMEDIQKELYKSPPFTGFRPIDQYKRTFAQLMYNLPKG